MIPWNFKGFRENSRDFHPSEFPNSWGSENSEKIRHNLGKTIFNFPKKTHRLYEKLHEEPEFEHRLCLKLDGVFGFALIYGDEFMAARDPIGVKPLYWGTDAQGRWMFRSKSGEKPEPGPGDYGHGGSYDILYHGSNTILKPKNCWSPSSENLDTDYLPPL